MTSIEDAFAEDRIPAVLNRQKLYALKDGKSNCIIERIF